MILIVNDRASDTSSGAQLLADAGWDVSTARSGREALDLLAHAPPPMLILIDPDADGWDTVKAIRGCGSPAAAAPIVACTDRSVDPERMHAAGFDDVLRKCRTQDEWVRTAETWQPDGAGAALDRLEASFGAEQIRSMVERFGAVVTEALEALDRGEAQPIAHRIAGTAGILGFTAVGKAWLAISEGDRSASADARRESRRALAAIARR